jgi:glycosyltransferase involved in cell wall biosynthesis
MTHKYKCSIFCSFFRGEKFIRGYIDDMLKQTIFKDIEFVFLDCASPENEKEVLIPLSKNHNNVIYHKLENDPGLYQAWNIAIKKCSAPIIGNWNIDDRKSINSIEILINKLEKRVDLDVVYGITYVSRIANETYEDNEYNLVYPYLPHSLENLLRNNSPHCMPLWRKNLHDRFGYFDESYMSAADGEFWLRCAFGGAKLELVNHPVGLYYENPTGRSTNPEHLHKCLEEVKRSRQKYIEILQEKYNAQQT